jgi:Na+/melibiose symporter-like transporter
MAPFKINLAAIFITLSALIFYLQSYVGEARILAVITTMVMGLGDIIHLKFVTNIPSHGESQGFIMSIICIAILLIFAAFAGCIVGTTERERVAKEREEVANHRKMFDEHTRNYMGVR